jgi:hypothetical protein
MFSLGDPIKLPLSSRTPGSREPRSATMAFYIAVQIVPRSVAVACGASCCCPSRPSESRGARRAARRHRIAVVGGPYCAELRVGSIERRYRFPEKVSGGSCSRRKKKKKMREHLVNMLCAQRPRVLAATVPPRRSKEKRTRGLTCACDGHFIALSSLLLCVCVKLGEEWIVVGFLVTALSWSALYEFRPAGEKARLGIEHSYPQMAPTHSNGFNVRANAFRGGQNVTYAMFLTRRSTSLTVHLIRSTGAGLCQRPSKGEVFTLSTV